MKVKKSSFDLFYTLDLFYNNLFFDNLLANFHRNRPSCIHLYRASERKAVETNGQRGFNVMFYLPN